MNVRNIYGRLRSVLNSKQRGSLSKIVFKLTNKPYVLKNKTQIEQRFPVSATGGLTVSADFEMAWAFRYSKRAINPLEMAALERENIPPLLNLFKKYSIPITWATVGHLFLESCRQHDHDWMHRLPYFDEHWKYISGDWFDHDPRSNAKDNNAWYAPDLIEMILSNPVNHEIGCHTFSHIDCSDKNCPPEVFEDEIVASIEAAAKWDIKLKSMVFPGGTAGNYQILKKHGFEIYRKNIDYDLAYPFRDKLGLLITPSTSSFGKVFDWSANYYIYRFKKIIDKAIATNTIAHIWLHPSVDKWTIQNVIPNVLKYADNQRSKGKLWVGTMGQIADFINIGIER